MVQAAIQLEQDPGGAGVFQQRLSAADQVVVIYQGAAFLGLGVGAQDGASEAQQGGGGFGHAPGAAIVLHPLDAGLFGQAGGDHLRVFVGEFAAGEGAGAARLAAVAKKLIDPVGPVFHPQVRRKAEPAEHASGLGLDGVCAMVFGQGQGLAQRFFVRPCDRVWQDAGFVAIG